MFDLEWVDTLSLPTYLPFFFSHRSLCLIFLKKEVQLDSEEFSCKNSDTLIFWICILYVSKNVLATVLECKYTNYHCVPLIEFHHVSAWSFIDNWHHMLIVKNCIWFFFNPVVHHCHFITLGTWHRCEPLCFGVWGICIEWCRKFYHFEVIIDLGWRWLYLIFWVLMLDNRRWQFPCTGMWSSWFFSCISIPIDFILIRIIFCRTMSLVRSHAYSGKNFFFVIVRFLETFVGSLSAGYLSLTLSLNNLFLLLFFQIHCMQQFQRTHEKQCVNIIKHPWGYWK